MVKRKLPEGAAMPQPLRDFQPFDVLWNGVNPPFPSEQSARWQVRQMRAQLAAAGALAIFRRRYFIHPERFINVIDRIAIDAACRKAVPPAEAGAVCDVGS